MSKQVPNRRCGVGRSHWVPLPGLVSRVDVTAIPIQCLLRQLVSYRIAKRFDCWIVCNLGNVKGCCCSVHAKCWMDLCTCCATLIIIIIIIIPGQCLSCCYHDSESLQDFTRNHINVMLKWIENFSGVSFNLSPTSESWVQLPLVPV